MPSWPRPESLLPPRLVTALEAAQDGDIARALELCAGADARDPLAGDVLRLVRGLATLERGESGRARRDLRNLATGADPALSLIATAALVEDLIARRRYAAALPLLRRQAKRQTDVAARTWTEALRASVLLQRRGSLPVACVETLEARLDRRQPGAVHAAVHLLRAERALLAGALAEAVSAQGEARPHVRSSGQAFLRRRLETLSQLLRAPFVEVEDWEEPCRAVSREDLAELEARPWRLWVDALHRSVRYRSRRGGAITTVELGGATQAWETLEALVRSPHRRLGWTAAVARFDVADVAAARARVERLQRELGAAGGAIVTDKQGLALRESHFVVVSPAAALPALALRVLGQLAAKPGASAATLADRGAARRTVVRHLAQLRRAGYVRLVGGGNEARYLLV